MCESTHNSALHYSAALGRTKMCRVLLDNGADPNYLNRFQQSPLHLAVKEDKLDCAEILIAYGANPYIHDLKGCLPHHYSIRADEVKRILVEMELDPKVQNVHLSSLHYMASVGKFEFVKYLLHRGANPNKLNKSGCAPLHLAMFNGQIECVNLLERNGAIINNMGTVNLTPLDFYLSHILNSITATNNASDIKNRLENSYICELIKKLNMNWKFSNFETILLLLTRNIGFGNQDLKLESLNMYVNRVQSSLKLNQNNDKNTNNSEMLNFINNYRKYKFIARFIGKLITSERNLIQNIFLFHKTNQDPGLLLINQIIVILLNFMSQIIKYNYENKQKVELNESNEFKLDKAIRVIFFDFIENLIKSGEINNCRSFICQICSKWFYKNYSSDAELTMAIATNNDVNDSVDANNVASKKKNEKIIRSLCFQYFEEMFVQLNSMMSQPNSLVDLCRINIKFNISNYPHDLCMYDAYIPNTIKKFLKYDSS